MSDVSDASRCPSTRPKSNLMNGLSNAFSFRSALTPSRKPNSTNDIRLAQKRIKALEAEVQRAREAAAKLDRAEKRIKKLEDEAQKSNVVAAQLNLELWEVKKQVKSYKADSRDLEAQKKTLDLSVESKAAATAAIDAQLMAKIADLERLLDITGVPSILTKLTTFNDTVRAAGGLLCSGVRACRYSSSEEDIKAARSTLTPLLDDEILDLIVSISEENLSKPSPSLVRVVSQALLIGLAVECRAQRIAKTSTSGLTKSFLMTQFKSLFRLAGWLPTTREASSAFEEILQQVVRAEEAFEGKFLGSIRKKDFSFYVSYHDKLFKGDEMQALDINGAPLSGILDGEAVFCTVGLGLASHVLDRDGDWNMVEPTQVVLSSTLLRAMNREAQGRDGTDKVAQLDGRD